MRRFIYLRAFWNWWEKRSICFNEDPIKRNLLCCLLNILCRWIGEYSGETKIYRIRSFHKSLSERNIFWKTVNDGMSNIEIFYGCDGFFWGISCMNNKRKMIFLRKFRLRSKPLVLSFLLRFFISFRQMKIVESRFSNSHNNFSIFLNGYLKIL